MHENSPNVINFLSLTEERSSLPPVHETPEVKRCLVLLLFVEFHIIAGLFSSPEFDWISSSFSHPFSVIEALPGSHFPPFSV